MRISDFPKSDLPNRLDSMRLAKEESYKYYYGIARPIDYIKARKIAFLEIRKNDIYNRPFEGYSILMMIYANGYGVKKDLDISMRLACSNVDGAPAETEGRTDHLKQMKAGMDKGIFDLCDDITSGYMMGFCQGVHSELSDSKRKSDIDSLTKNWKDSEKMAYTELRKIATFFFNKSSDKEVDQSGTARSAMMGGAMEELEDVFISDVFRADKCNFSCYTKEEYIKVDRDLNEIYLKVLKDKRLDVTYTGMISREGIRNTQREWIRYRDAWVNFGKIKCPQFAEHEWKTMITKERVRQLKSLFEN